MEATLLYGTLLITDEKSFIVQATELKPQAQCYKTFLRMQFMNVHNKLESLS
jgi:hypothetical protein